MHARESSSTAPPSVHDIFSEDFEFLISSSLASGLSEAYDRSWVLIRKGRQSFYTWQRWRVAVIKTTYSGDIQ